ncbi:Hypothetical protein P9515_04111 [Prochlorococcus marinus str. MIT 9515]|uniref:Uncharacterized protein n=2 Tax=Prochlorococcus marinus TaxID=1219 RepID=A2BV09_PROM5|nr:Hypothetical protein P9515_04111 [Prochlorococcus marinus str. MIT 9515]
MFKQYFYKLKFSNLSFLKTMSTENNLEKSSQDYKKSQYGSWYKKNAENKKKDKKEEKNKKEVKISFFKKIKSLFNNS